MLNRQAWTPMTLGGLLFVSGYLAALGGPKYADHDNNAGMVVVVSATVDWVKVIETSGMTVQDADPITDPDGDITSSTRHILKRGKQTSGEHASNEGSLLVLRMAYDADFTAITDDPVVKVFGRMDDTEGWTLLKTKAGAISATLRTDLVNDVSDGTTSYTTPDLDLTAWDTQGCREIIVGVEVILAGTGGTANEAFLQAKLL